MPSLRQGWNLRLSKREWVAIPCSLNVHCLSHVRLHIDEHLSLDLGLFSLGLRLFLLHGPRGLIQLLFLLDEILLVLILDLDLGCIGLADVVQ